MTERPWWLLGSPHLALLAGLAAIVAGCASQPDAPRRLAYLCDDGRELALSIAPSGETASIEIARMNFSLVAEPVAGPGQTYSCSMLTVKRLDDLVSVEMEGSPRFSNCRIRH